MVSDEQESTEWVENDYGRFRLRAEGIGEVRPHEKWVDSLTAAQDNVAAMTSLVGANNLTPWLIDLRDMRSTSREARQYYAKSPEALAIVSCIALLVGGPSSRVLGNFFLGLNRPAYPTRLFTSESEAILWLQAHRPAPQSRTRPLAGTSSSTSWCRSCPPWRPWTSPNA